MFLTLGVGSSSGVLNWQRFQSECPTTRSMFGLAFKAFSAFIYLSDLVKSPKWLNGKLSYVLFAMSGATLFKP